MSVTSPRDKARRCFALARSTQHDGERDNAIRLGTQICERHGFDLDDFDIPGRTRTRRVHASQFRETLFDRPRAPPRYTAAEASDLMRQLAEAMYRAGFEMDEPFQNSADHFREAVRREQERRRRDGC